MAEQLIVVQEVVGSSPIFDLMIFKTVELFIFSIINCLIVFALIAVTMLFSPKNPSSEKVGAYECGFEPFSDARKNFDIHFYVVAILFIIFDVEIVFLLPWVLSLNSLDFSGFYLVVFFLFLFLVGFAYEWQSGIIDWVWYS